jgi:hypothetical protein
MYTRTINRIHPFVKGYLGKNDLTGNDMTDIVTATEDEAERLVLQGKAIILGGVEVHIRSVRGQGDPGIQVDYTPPFGPDDCPDWMEGINTRLTGLCQQTVMKVNDHVRMRLLRLAGQDGGNDRMIYRLFVTSRIADDGSHETRVRDYVDPEFSRVDRRVDGRAEKARRFLERLMKRR